MNNSLASRYCKSMAQITLPIPQRTGDPFDHDNELMDVNIELSVSGTVGWKWGAFTVSVASATDRNGNDYDDLPEEQQAQVEASLLLEFIETAVGATKYW